MSRLRSLAAISLGLSLAATIAAQAPDPRTLGPKIGERVPSFTLPDQHGVSRSLQSAFGPKGVVLVFYRSADW